MNDTKIVLKDKQNENLRNNILTFFNAAVATESNLNVTRRIQNAPELPIGTVVENALKQTKLFYFNKIDSGNWDADSVWPMEHEALITLAQQVVQGNNGNLSAIDAKYARIKRQKKIEAKEKLTKITASLKEMGYKVSIDNSMIDISGRDERDQIKYHVNALKDLGLKIKELEEIK